MKRAIILLLALTQMVCAAEPQIERDWVQQVHGGVDRVDCLDLDGFSPKAYAINFDPSKSIIYVYGQDGTPDYMTTATQVGTQESGKESTLMAAVDDVDHDRFLDLYPSTVIKAAYVTNHRLYRLIRQGEKGLEGLRNKYFCKVVDTGLITSIKFEDTNGDGNKEVVTSSVDDRVRAFDVNCEDTVNITLNSSLWDVTPVRIETPNYRNYTDNETLEEIIEEYNVTRYIYLAGGFEGLYLVNGSGYVLWFKPGDRVEKTMAFDYEGNGTMVFTGATGDLLEAYDIKGVPLWNITLPNIAGMEFLEIENISGRLLVVAAGEKLAFIDGRGTVKWEYAMNDTAKSIRVCKDKERTRILVGGQDSLAAYRLSDVYVKGADARNLYKNAQAAYEKGDFARAARLCNESLNRYSEIDTGDDVSEIVKLRDNAEKLVDAELIYDDAVTSFGNGKYDQAIDLAEQAKDIYTLAGYESGVNKSALLDAKARAKVGNRPVTKPSETKKAEEYYTIAEAYFMNGTYHMSYTYANMSYEEYSKVGYEPGMKLAKNLMSMNLRYMDKPTTSTTIKKESPEPTQPKPTKTPTKKTEAWPTRDDIITYVAIAAGFIILALVIYPRRK